MLAARTAMVKHPFFESRGTSCDCFACSEFDVFSQQHLLGFYVRFTLYSRQKWRRDRRPDK